jgi:glycerol-3-phosphate dehydrogenase
MFVLPAGDHTIIGTTETAARGGPDEVRATREEVRYLLEACSANFPAAALRDDDVVAAWSGIRPLAATLADGDAGSASREHTVAEGALGVLTVTGGKLTTYRAMAEEVVDRVCDALGEPQDGRPFREVPLPGGVMRSLSATEDEARGAIGDGRIAHRLAHAHGSAWRDVWRLTRDDSPALAERIDDALPYTFAEALYAVQFEWAVTLADILVRRMHLAFECRDHGAQAAARVATMLAPRLGWDAARIAEERRRYDRETERLFGID